MDAHETETNKIQKVPKKKQKLCPFREMTCGPHCSLYNGGYNACSIKLMAASVMKIAEFRKDYNF